PPWAVVGREAFRAFVHRNGFEERLEGLVSAFDPACAQAIALEAGKLLLGGVLDDELRQLFDAAYRQVGGGAVAVRSSAVEEDGRTLSFAGQFETALNVTGLDRVSEQIRRCWASLFSERAMLYRHLH